MSDQTPVCLLSTRVGLLVVHQVSMLFEVEDLKVASPATVSRCGMVYYDYVDLGWKPYIYSWLESKQHKVRNLSVFILAQPLHAPSNQLPTILHGASMLTLNSGAIW